MIVEDTLLFLPPIAFVIILVVMALQLFGLRIFSASVKISDGTGGRQKAYACGEDVKTHRVQPDYSQFFPFAFFFTIMHVVALIVATVPAGSLSIAVLASGYLAAAAIGLLILYRR